MRTGEEIEAEHECTFAEEEEPSGRLILGPCLECSLPAMEIAQQLAEIRVKLAAAEDTIWRARLAFAPVEFEENPDYGAVLDDVGEILSGQEQMHGTT